MFGRALSFPTPNSGHMTFTTLKFILTHCTVIPGGDMIQTQQRDNTPDFDLLLRFTVVVLRDPTVAAAGLANNLGSVGLETTGSLNEGIPSAGAGLGAEALCWPEDYSGACS